MKRKFIVFILILYIVSMMLEACGGSSGSSGTADSNTASMKLKPATGPLRVSSSNPRYFVNADGEVVYLTGSHTWQNLQDRETTFDYGAYLDFLQQHNHNFIRLWAWEDSRHEPLPYIRTGPRVALDGKPKFDLTQFNQGYFDRLRYRVIAALDRGIYVSVMLFGGWSIERKSARRSRNPWNAHPFNIDNNINGINGDPNGNGQGEETHTLQVSGVTNIQEAYARKVIDTLNDLDNVLWEISNESHSESQDWQYHMINFIKSYEANKPKQHLVGMTVEWPNGDNSELFASPGDWISPNESGGYRHNPPEANGMKVIISDTDHLGWAYLTRGWVWKSFVRGLHTIFMDPYLREIEDRNNPTGSDTDPIWDPIRQSMGYTLTYANKMNLADMIPQNGLASTRYCLANAGSEYLVYLPFGSHWIEPWIELLPWQIESRIRSRDLFRRTTEVDLTAASGALSVEWFNPATGETKNGGTTKGGAILSFTAPFDGDAVLYLAAGKAAIQE